MDREEIDALIRSAFANVVLGSGISLRQAQVIDGFGRGYTHAAFEALPLSEVTDDWTRVPDSELLRNCMSHMDAKGFRYYLPAMMLWLLDNYESGTNTGAGMMTAVETIRALAPDARFAEATWAKYETFTPDQLVAVARLSRRCRSSSVSSRTMRRRWPQDSTSTGLPTYRAHSIGSNHPPE